nr:hypothetical protein [Tanacetum cinerariifolium]
MSRLLNIKSDFNISQSCYDRIMQAVKEFIPDSTLCSNYYESKKIVSQLGLGYQKIDVCPNDCMIYYNEENKDNDKCQVCSHLWYKPIEQDSLKMQGIPYKYMHYLPLTPRLQRLYMSKDTAQHMTWHHGYRRDHGVLSHPSDGEAWKHFDQTHPSFAAEPRNVRDHSFRRKKDGFIKVQVERDEPPPRLSGEEIWSRVLQYPKKNMFDNIFNTKMDDNDKTKDNGKARQDVKEYCKRREQELVSDVDGKVSKPKESFSLTKEQKQVVLQWVKKLQFADGYASNLSRCADVHKGKMFGMKSHDCHVFMERLLPIAFREMLPEPVWKEMTKILSPAFFDHMEHLVVHLSYEARVGGHVQYSWMYPFKRVRRNDDVGNVNEREDVLSIFKHPLRTSGNSKRRYLNDDEYETAIFYVLQNCEEIQPFFRIFEGEVKLEMPNITNNQLVDVTKKKFGRWLRDYVYNLENQSLVNHRIQNIALGPSRDVITYHMCYVNGFSFHTMHHSSGQKTTNIDLCLIGEEGEYYGHLMDIIEVDYIGWSKLNTLVLFKCDWFETVKNQADNESDMQEVEIEQLTYLREKEEIEEEDEEEES